jgi:YbgC/YbaW family acyl-CoA thioester hydrolase
MVMTSGNSHKTPLTVRGYELDSYGHVNNAVYMNYFEHGRWQMFRDEGLSEIIHQSGVLLVVTDVHIRYMREAKLYDSIIVETRTLVEPPYLIFKQRLLNPDKGLPLARSETKTVFIDESRKPVDIPEAFLRHFGREEPKE